MQPRSIVLSSLAGLIFVALVYLSVKVNATPNTGASDQELAQARSFHKRNKRVSPAGAPVTSDARKSSRVKQRRSVTKPRITPPERPKVQSKRGAWNSPRVKPMRRLGLASRRGIRGKRGTELRTQMRATNRAYDRQDYDEASKQALDILKKHPRNIRMLRVVVSSACFMGEGDRARKYYAKLPKRDKAHMRIRCSRMKIKLDE